MSAPSSEASKGQFPIQTSPIRPRGVPRTVTEVAAPSLPKISQRHHHHHPHLHRSREKEPHSASPKLQPSLSNTGEGNISNDGSHDVSRRGSIIGDEPKRKVSEKQLAEEKERGLLRASELRNSVLELNTLSNNMTSRLDNSYYNVLEKLSILQSTITSLKELANMTKIVSEEFKAESQEVMQDAKSQLNAFESFTEQEKRINALKSRIVRGREQIKILGDRVDSVKERVDSWEQADWEWQEKTRKRLNIMWTMIGIAALIFIAIKGFQYMPANTTDPHLSDALNTSGLLGKIPDLEDLKNETWKLERKIEKSFDGLESGAGEEALGEEDPRLRIFDEL